jgi:3-oxoacyl-[acyl-carrier-protein] synthase III
MFIRGVGTYLPERVPIDWAVGRGLISAGDAEAMQLTGTLVAKDVPSAEMALRAARDAVERCGQPPRELDLMLYADTWHQGPEGWLPCSYLQRHLTGGGVPAVEIVHGCSGMFGAMELAASYLQADPDRVSALLIASDNYAGNDASRWRKAPFIAGDAATALVLGKEPGFARLLSVCSGIVADEAELNRAGQPLFPPAATLGRETNLFVRRAARKKDPAERAKLIERMHRLHDKFKEVAQRAMSEAGITIDDVTRLGVVHTMREVVDDRGMATLGVDFSKSTWEYGRGVGHCGASDQVMAFNHLLSTGELKPGDHFMMLGTGPGIVLCCAIIEILQTPAWLPMAGASVN